MDQPHPGAPQSRRRIIYIGAVVALVALTILGVTVFDQIKANADATGKAEVLHSRLNEAGLPAPAVQTLAHTFGEDGVAACADPVAAFRQAQGLTTGAPGPGARATIGDEDLVQGEVIVIATYCPDKLAAFTKQIRTMKFGETVKK